MRLCLCLCMCMCLCLCSWLVSVCVSAPDCLAASLESMTSLPVFVLHLMPFLPFSICIAFLATGCEHHVVCRSGARITQSGPLSPLLSSLTSPLPSPPVSLSLSSCSIFPACSLCSGFVFCFWFVLFFSMKLSVFSSLSNDVDLCALGAKMHR